MSQLKYKVCGMTDPKNVEEVCAVQPDFLGFIFYPRSLRYVGSKPDPALFEAVAEGIEKTAVFVNEYYEQMIDIMVKFGIRTVQLHGMESPETCNTLRSHGMTVIKVIPGDQLENVKLMKDYEGVVDYFLFDTPVRSFGGSGRKFDWSKIEKCKPRRRFFLSGGISINDADRVRALDMGNLYAIDINSRFETEPGIKNPALVGEFLNILRNGKN